MLSFTLTLLIPMLALQVAGNPLVSGDVDTSKTENDKIIEKQNNTIYEIVGNLTQMIEFINSRHANSDETPTDTSAASMTTLGTTSVLQPEKEGGIENVNMEECIEPEEGDTNVDLTGEGPDVDNKDESNNHDVEQNIPNTEHVEDMNDNSIDEGLTVDSKDESNIHEEPAADKEVPVIETTPVPVADTTQNVVVNRESDVKAVDTANEELNTNIITQGTTEQERKQELQRKKAERRAEIKRNKAKNEADKLKRQQAKLKAAQKPNDISQ